MVPTGSEMETQAADESTCTGIWDGELIDDVGMTLYMRCRDILNIHRAKSERQVTCPRCAATGRTTLIDASDLRGKAMRCPACDWSMTWYAYRRTFHRKQLNPGGAVAFFHEFVRKFETPKTPKEKMLAIDRVIHEFHYSSKAEPDRPTRAAGVNLISGRLDDVVTFLNELSGLNLPRSMRATIGLEGTPRVDVLATVPERQERTTTGTSQVKGRASLAFPLRVSALSSRGCRGKQESFEV